MLPVRVEACSSWDVGIRWRCFLERQIEAVRVLILCQARGALRHLTSDIWHEVRSAPAVHAVPALGAIWLRRRWSLGWRAPVFTLLYVTGVAFTTGKMTCDVISRARRKLKTSYPEYAATKHGPVRETAEPEAHCDP